MRQDLKARLSAATTAAGLVFLMWAFFCLPTFHGQDWRMRVGAAIMGAHLIKVAIDSKKLTSRLEICALAVSATVGIAVFAIGLVAHFLR